MTTLQEALLDAGFKPSVKKPRTKKFKKAPIFKKNKDGKTIISTKIKNDREINDDKKDDNKVNNRKTYRPKFKKKSI